MLDKKRDPAYVLTELLSLYGIILKFCLTIRYLKGSRNEETHVNYRHQLTNIPKAHTISLLLTVLAKSIYLQKFAQATQGTHPFPLLTQPRNIPATDTPGRM